MIPDFDPDGYPGPRPPGPVLVLDGELHPVRLDGPAHAPIRLAPAAGGGPADGGRVDARSQRPPSRDARSALGGCGRLRWSVAYGSNASPGRLVAKGLDQGGAVLLPARLVGFMPAFEHRRTGYGSVPLTLVPSDGAVHDTWVLGVRPDATDRLDLTEGRVPGEAPHERGPESGDGRYAPPGAYRLARVGPVAVADRFVLPSALAYLPGPATRVQVTPDGGWRTWPTWDQAAAGEHLDRAWADRAAPVVERAVRGRWPATPLEDPPMFVYGTLRPDGPAWERIADLVRVIGPATAPGTLFDTGRGWPAASFADASSPARIHGHLLAARGPAQAQELVERTDAYEDVPRSFVRASVLVDGPAGRGWALGYARSDGAPPGAPIASGKWVVR